jgi:hypothetical protein
MQNRICSWSFLVETAKEGHWAMGYVHKDRDQITVYKKYFHRAM